MPITTLLEAGDHVVVTDNTYGGTYRSSNRCCGGIGCSFTYVDTSCLDQIEAGDSSRDEDAVCRDADQSR